MSGGIRYQVSGKYQIVDRSNINIQFQLKKGIAKPDPSDLIPDT